MLKEDTMVSSAQTIEETTQPFSMTITGQLERVDNEVFLTTQEQTKFRVSWHWDIEKFLERGEQQWKVIPSTSPEGIIQFIFVMRIADDEDADDEDKADVCELIGRVVQLSKRTSTVMLKVDRPKQKTLKLTLNEPPPQMKVGQLWNVLAKIKADRLQIEYAYDVEGNRVSGGGDREQVDSTPSKQAEDNGAVKRILNSGELNDGSPRIVSETFKQTTARLLPHAKDAIENTTKLSGWVFNSPVQRRNFWEWEAVLSQSIEQPPLRARIQVNPSTLECNIRQYHQLSTTATSVLEKDEEADDLDWDDVEDDEDGDDGKITIEDRLIVTPLGAALGIGASCFRVLIGPYEVVLDAGTRPKGHNPLPAFEYLNNPNLILITHAHQDHIGALPVFHREFPIAPMICTAGTREIADIMLTDCLKIQQSNEDFAELFDETDLNQTIFHLETQQVGVDFEPLPGLIVRFIHAGHIVGAACVYLRYGKRSLFYTGDYNTTSSRTTDGLRLADLPEADILITESTYGADTHPSRKAQEAELLQAVAEVVQQGGNVLIPAFALGRAQEIILAIRTSALFHNLKIPVYVDGLVRAVTDVFNDNLNFLPQTVQNFAKQEEPFFNPNGTPPISPIAHPRERPLAIAKPSVIIASSGMLSGGASVYYGQALLERDNAAIFISGYTDEESPGRFLQSLKKGDEVEIEGKILTVRAQVRRFNLSAHADKIGLTQVIHKVNPKHLILIHGSKDALHELSRTGDLRDKYIIHIPDVGDAIEYGRAPEHISHDRLAQIESPQEFEISIEAEMEGAWLRIPEEVMSDPRWQKLGSSGVLKAKWWGATLNLSAVNHRHLAIEKAIASGEDCCAVCQFFDKRHCQCPESPLFSLLVDPSAKCLEFERCQTLQSSEEDTLNPDLEPDYNSEEDEDIEDMLFDGSFFENNSASTAALDEMSEDLAQSSLNSVFEETDELIDYEQPASLPTPPAASDLPNLEAMRTSFLLTLKPASRKESAKLINQFITSVKSYLPDFTGESLVAQAHRFLLTLKPNTRNVAAKLINKFVEYLKEQL